MSTFTHCLIAEEEQPAFNPTCLHTLCYLQQGSYLHRELATEVAYESVSQLISRKGKT